MKSVMQFASECPCVGKKEQKKEKKHFERKHIVLSGEGIMFKQGSLRAALHMVLVSQSGGKS